MNAVANYFQVSYKAPPELYKTENSTDLQHYVSLTVLTTLKKFTKAPK